MMTPEQKAWREERIVKTRELIVIYEDAIGQLATGAQSYTLDTGQSRQVVTRQDLGSMRLMLAELEAKLARLEDELAAALYGSGGAVYVRPHW